MEIPELRSSKRDDTWCGPLVEPASNSSKLNLCNAKPTSSSLLSLFEELTSTGHSRKVVVEDVGDFVLLCSDVGFVGIGMKNDYFLTDRASEQDGRLEKTITNPNLMHHCTRPVCALFASNCARPPAALRDFLSPSSGSGTRRSSSSSTAESQPFHRAQFWISVSAQSFICGPAAG